MNLIRLPANDAIRNMNTKNKDARKKSTTCTVRLPIAGYKLSSIVIPVNVKPLRSACMFTVFVTTWM